MNFDAVIFDLDGTLLDSLEDIATAANRVLASMGQPQRDLAEYKTLVGDGVSVLFQRAYPECATEETLRRECMHRFDVEYEHCWHNRSKPYEGIREMLSHLNSCGMTLAVLSNKPEPFTKRCVQHFFHEYQFTQVLGHSARFPRKPDPASAIWIGEQLGYQANRIAYVGDTNTDMKTAVGASFFAMGVSWGFRTARELVESGAQVVFDHPSELLAGLIG